MGSLTTIALTIQTWYMSINKPVWAPPVWMFGVAWSIIYPLIAVSFGYVFWKSFIKHQWRHYIGVLFAVNLVANLMYGIGTFAAFSDQQSLEGIKQMYWPATILILIVLLTLPAMMFATWERAKWVTFLQIPYIAWVLLATSLQIAIDFTN